MFRFAKQIFVSAMIIFSYNVLHVNPLKGIPITIKNVK